MISSMVTVLISAYSGLNRYCYHAIDVIAIFNNVRRLQPQFAARLRVSCVHQVKHTECVLITRLRLTGVKLMKWQNPFVMILL